MIQLRILSGKKAGTSWVARRFPVRIGRSDAADLQLPEEGIRDQHLQLDWRPSRGFELSARPEALAAVNGHAVRQILLRNGDLIEIGSLKLQFWLSETRQRGFRVREWLLWLLLALVSLSQIALVYWLGS